MYVHVGELDVCRNKCHCVALGSGDWLSLALLFKNLCQHLKGLFAANVCVEAGIGAWKEYIGISIAAFTPSVSVSVNTSIKNEMGPRLIKKRQSYSQ